MADPVHSGHIKTLVFMDIPQVAVQPPFASIHAEGFILFLPCGVFGVLPTLV